VKFRDVSPLGGTRTMLPGLLRRFRVAVFAFRLAQLDMLAEIGFSASTRMKSSK